MVYFDLQLKDTVHHGNDLKVARAWNSWLCLIYNEEAQDDEVMLSSFCPLASLES